jgi:peptidoglycan/xylan/chitin deacetylase (PgdA/CDA1 family)
VDSPLASGQTMQRRRIASSPGSAAVGTSPTRYDLSSATPALHSVRDGHAGMNVWSPRKPMSSLTVGLPLKDPGIDRMKKSVATSVRAFMKNAVYDAFPGVLRRGASTAKRVALTFDDGPDHMTERYLALLDKLGVPATFFLIGLRAAERPDLVREYLRRGHQVASHGYDHKRFNTLSRRALLDQCARTDDALGGQLSGRPWVRPPHGSLDIGSLLNLVTSGYTVAMWSVDSYDYSTTNPAEIVEHCSHASAGDVVLFHEGQQCTLDALPGVVSSLQEAGLEFVTMHDLFAS